MGMKIISFLVAVATILSAVLTALLRDSKKEPPPLTPDDCTAFYNEAGTKVAVFNFTKNKCWCYTLSPAWSAIPSSFDGEFKPIDTEAE